MGPPRGVRAAAEGARLHLEGWNLLRRERSLWGLALLPSVLSLVACSATVAGLIVYAGPLHAFVTGWMPVLHAESPIAWLWVGPARLLFAVAGLLLFAAASATALVLALLLANLLASPFLDALSRRVEAIARGGAEAPREGGLAGLLRQGARAAREELHRATFFVALQSAILLLGIAIPGGQALVSPAWALVTMFFLPLNYAAYTLDRRGVSFRAQRRWVLDRAPLMFGYGGTALVIFLVPGLNFLLLPVLVSSGTLLALRHPPKR